MCFTCKLFLLSKQSKGEFTMNDFYVYVYIDPRNFEDFYYGKGKGKRKFSHLNDKSDSQKVKRIKEIQKEGLEPIIRVIARNLSEKEAFLIEASFLWKMGRFTANLNSGHISKYFRPLNTLHKELYNFDFENGLFYYNIGEGEHRNWDDYLKYNFISAGQGKKFSDAIKGFSPGDIFVAYLKGNGFVGVGKIISRAIKIQDAVINGVKLLDCKLKAKSMNQNLNNSQKSEYICHVEWIKTFSRSKAKWSQKSGLYTTTHVKADLTKQRTTIDFINKHFNLDLESYVK